MKYIFRLCLLCLIISSCTPDNVEVNTFNSTDFPMKVGNSWTYRRSDRIAWGYIDTLTLEVNSMTENAGTKTYTIHVKLKEYLMDSLKATYTNNVFYQQLPNYPIAYFGDYKVEMPFNVGSSWLATSYPDSSKVKNRYDNFQGLVQSYPNTYLIVRDRMPFAPLQKDSIWLAKGIGIVKQYIKTQYQTAYYELISYHLN